MNQSRSIKPKSRSPFLVRAAVWVALLAGGVPQANPTGPCVSRAQTDALYENSQVSCLLQQASREVDDPEWGSQKKGLLAEAAHIDALKRMPSNAKFLKNLDREKERIARFIALKDKLRSKECAGDEESELALVREAAQAGVSLKCSRVNAPALDYLNPILISSGVDDATKNRVEKVDMMSEIADMAYEDSMKSSLETAMTLVKKYNPDCAKSAKPDYSADVVAEACALDGWKVEQLAMNIICPGNDCGIEDKLKKHAAILLGTKEAAANGGNRNPAFGRLKSVPFQSPNTTVTNLRASVAALNKSLERAPGVLGIHNVPDPYLSLQMPESKPGAKPAPKAPAPEKKLSPKEVKALQDYIKTLPATVPGKAAAPATGTAAKKPVTPANAASSKKPSSSNPVPSGMVITRSMDNLPLEEQRRLANFDKDAYRKYKELYVDTISRGDGVLLYTNTFESIVPVKTEFQVNGTAQKQLRSGIYHADQVTIASVTGAAKDALNAIARNTAQLKKEAKELEEYKTFRNSFSKDGSLSRDGSVVFDSAGVKTHEKNATKTLMNYLENYPASFAKAMMSNPSRYNDRVCSLLGDLASKKRSDKIKGRVAFWGGVIGGVMLGGAPIAGGAILAMSVGYELKEAHHEYEEGKHKYLQGVAGLYGEGLNGSSASATRYYWEAEGGKELQAAAVKNGVTAVFTPVIAAGVGKLVAGPALKLVEHGTKGATQAVLEHGVHTGSHALVEGGVKAVVAATTIELLIKANDALLNVGNIVRTNVGGQKVEGMVTETFFDDEGNQIATIIDQERQQFINVEVKRATKT